MAQGPTVRLWERVGRAQAPDESGAPRTGEIVLSIRRHLACLLNTRRGDSPASPEYGLPDLTGVVLGLPKSENEFSRAVQEAIIRFEPRLKDVRVRVDLDQPFAQHRIRFMIEARIADPSDYQRHRMSCEVSSDIVFNIE